MKTIYTDKLGIYPWALLFLSAISFWWAYDTVTGGRHAPFGIHKTTAGIIFVLCGGYWLFLAARRFRDVRSATREGRDPTIIRIKE
jgi:hypothetical protein